MSVYHTPRCRIVWTKVRSNGVVRDVVDQGATLTLSFGLEFDPALYREASEFHFRFGIPMVYNGGYTAGSMDQLPGGGSGNIWMAISWEAAVFALDRKWGAILYRPFVYFVIPDALDEFAVAEEDHYIFGERPFLGVLSLP